jgi:molybdenum cofactor cytidylyltransferase
VGVLVVLGDQPGLSAALLESLIRAFRAGPRGIVVPTALGTRGHPLLFHSRYVTEVQQHFDAVGLRGLLQAHPEDVAEVETDDPAALADLDEPADYQRLRDSATPFQ